MKLSPYWLIPIALVVMVAVALSRRETAPTITAAPNERTYTQQEIMGQSMIDAGNDKARRMLFISGNPQVTLYDTLATHPACSINGKQGQIAEAGRNGFTCYRWVRGNVAVRLGDGKWAMIDGDKFTAK